MLTALALGRDLQSVTDAYADRICVSDGRSELRYDELAQRAGRLADHLLADGVVPGEPVATCLRNGIPAVWASYGARLAGAAETPLNPVFTAAERRYCLELAGVRRVITTEDEAPFFRACGVSTITVETIDDAPADLATLPAVPTNAWGRIGFTSGTTGRPKAIVHTHGARWLANILLRATFAAMPSPDSRILLMTPYTHGAGLLTAAFHDHGATVVLLDGVVIDEVQSQLATGSIDFVFAPPTVLAKLTAAFEGRRFGGIRTVFCGTAPLTPALYARARALFGPVVRITYGKTEVVNPITVLPPEATDAYYAGEANGDGFCVGWPASGVEVAVRRDDGSPCEAHEVGEIYLRAQHMLCGTIDGNGFHPTAPGEFHATGDLGRIDGRGRLHLVGRTADVIKSGGYKVHPAEIESTLESAAGLAATVIALPSAYWGEVIIAVVESPTPGWGEAARIAAETLANFKRPRAYVAFDMLPRNAQGKIPRARVRDMVLERYTLLDGPHPRLEVRRR